MEIEDQFFIKKGYLHVDQVLLEEECDLLRQIFVKEVKQCNKLKLRQRSVTYTEHKFSPCGFMENALLDVHRMDVLDSKNFVDSACRLLMSEKLSQYIVRMIGLDSVLVQSMYFEGGRGTIPHFDKFFLGVDEGRMIGVWIALEDIDASSGRFFIYPRSHDSSFSDCCYQEELVQLFAEYKKLNAIAISGHQKNSDRHHVRAVIRSKKVLSEIITLAGWQKEYPIMKKGDVLFFSSSTLHGSDVPDKIHSSRHSLTAHFVNTSSSYLRYGDLIEPLNIVECDGLRMHLSQRYHLEEKIG